MALARLYPQPDWSNPQQMFPDGDHFATVNELTSARTWSRPMTAMTTTSSTISSLTRTRSSARDELNVPSQCHYPHFLEGGGLKPPTPWRPPRIAGCRLLLFTTILRPARCRAVSLQCMSNPRRRGRNSVESGERAMRSVCARPGRGKRCTGER